MNILIGQEPIVRCTGRPIEIEVYFIKVSDCGRFSGSWFIIFSRVLIKSLVGFYAGKLISVV